MGMNRVREFIPLNCRPNSLLPIISKVMESIIAVDMKSFLSSINLISDYQFGFRPGHSALNMLLIPFQQWMEALNVRYEIRAVSRDISRAFKTVWAGSRASHLTQLGTVETKAFQIIGGFHAEAVCGPIIFPSQKGPWNLGLLSPPFWS